MKYFYTFCEVYTPIHAKYIDTKTFEGIYYMNDVYRRINNTHNTRDGLHLVTVCSDSELKLMLRSRPIGRTELPWPIIDLTF